MKNLKIAIVGAGVAGMAAAIFLKRQGHQVMIYEKFDHPQPLGAGLLLQPTGLAVLKKLGLDGQVTFQGSRIDALFGKAYKSPFITLDVKYQNLGRNLFGVGVHRGHLFLSLYRQIIAEQIPLQPSAEIMEAGGQNPCYIQDKNGQTYGPYDLIVDCSGVKSALREKHAKVKLNKTYPYGALWSIVTLKDTVFHPHRLEQRYKNTTHMIGVLPVGINQQNGLPQAAFFYSLKAIHHENWLKQPFNLWQREVISIWPETESLVSQFQNHQDLIFARYRDVILKKTYTDTIVFLGDAAHCSSPQLGQGANLALIDAWMLSQSLAEEDNIEEALALYAKTRRKHVRFYQFYSRLLTPFFQSDSWLLSKLRFLSCGVPCKIRFTQKIAAQVLSGRKTGVFSRMKEDWLQEYEDQIGLP